MGKLGYSSHIHLYLRANDELMKYISNPGINKENISIILYMIIQPLTETVCKCNANPVSWT